MAEQECGERLEHARNDQSLVAVEIQPISLMMRKLGTNVTAAGIMSVARIAAEDDVAEAVRDPRQPVAGHRRDQHRAGGLQHRHHRRVHQTPRERHGRVVEQVGDVREPEGLREELPRRRRDLQVRGEPVAHQQVERHEERHRGDDERRRRAHSSRTRRAGRSRVRPPSAVAPATAEPEQASLHDREHGDDQREDHRPGTAVAEVLLSGRGRCSTGTRAAGERTADRCPRRRSTAGCRTRRTPGTR